MEFVKWVAPLFVGMFVVGVGSGSWGASAPEASPFSLLTDECQTAVRDVVTSWWTQETRWTSIEISSGMKELRSSCDNFQEFALTEDGFPLIPIPPEIEAQAPIWASGESDGDCNSYRYEQGSDGCGSGQYACATALQEFILCQLPP